MSALADVYYDRVLQPWAMERADFANVHFRQRGTPAYLVEDFLGGGDRNERTLKDAREHMAVMSANAALAKMLPGQPPTDDVPAWAIGEYRQCQQ